MNDLVVLFGRMNPPTIGHRYIISEAMSFADSKNCDFVLFLSTKQDIHNPLIFDDKKKILQRVFPDIAIEPAPGNGMFGILENNDENYKSAYIVCGQDRVKDFQRIASYNGNEFQYDDIHILSDKFRNKNCIYQDVSATGLRKAARQFDYETFSKHFIDMKSAKDGFKLCQKGLNIAL